MAFLQGVDVFARLSADETLQLAMIANERRVMRGDVIYRRDDPPDQMFTVVEGRVRLDGAADDRRVVGPSGRFGVYDILSSRPRTHTAVADEDTHLLAIEAEDFFDLLVGNVGIVKALFRQVLRGDEAAAGR
jgi:CRP-like cAMP-binding protein